jgi:2-polyprenyl-3-methyl-5-hydroxy-6-metoxy-1,4-benzoquinol methylase
MRESESKELKTNIGYYGTHRTEMLKYIPSGAVHILEVGCGEGNFCRLLKRKSNEVWGLEINTEAAQKAEKICDKVLIGSFDEIYPQLPAGYFDCVVFNDVLEHLYDPWTTVKQVRTLLSERGVLVTSIPNFRYISNIITEILFQKDFQYKPEGGILDDTHIRFFTSKSMLRMFREAGYEVVTHEGLRPCKSWKEKLFISLSLGFLKDARYKQFATVARAAQLR